MLEKLVSIFSRFGPISSSVVKYEANIGRPFAFICFEDHEAAEVNYIHYMYLLNVN